MNDQPLLTIAVPAYKRPDLLRRCLASLRSERAATNERIEVVVSDNSPDDAVERVATEVTAQWRDVPVRYHRNPEGTGAVNNFNLCVERARGLYVLVLHDDDYLLDGGIDAMVDVLADRDLERDRVVLFGVRVVTMSGDVRRRQEFARDRYLPPREAYRRLLRDSSFVRFPGLVAQTSAYREVGGFRVDAYTTCDFDLQVRLFGRFGLFCSSATTAAYVLHEGSVTTSVFNPRTIELNWRAFQEARQTGVVDNAELHRLMRTWYHQFILAGAVRSLRARDWTAARRVMGLFSLPRIRQLGVSPRWFPLRAALTAAAPPIAPDNASATEPRATADW